MAQLRDALEASLGNEKATLFRPEVINKNGQPIVFYRENGQLKALRLADGKLGEQMFQMFQMMQTHERHLLTDILAGSASMMPSTARSLPSSAITSVIPSPHSHQPASTCRRHRRTGMGRTHTAHQHAPASRSRGSLPPATGAGCRGRWQGR